jgi:hypothetical protein
MELIKAEHLKTKFEVEGSFYNIEIGSKVFECRNYAQVYRIDSKNNQWYDAIFVLANPGLCTPKQSSYEIPHLSVEETAVNYTLAKTDNTQYQIMRFMQLKNWNKILLINLSDIRAGNLNEFRKKLNEAKKAGFESHSIFSALRVNELKKVIAQCTGQTILAWGTDPIVKQLANRACDVLPQERIIGMKHEKAPFYYHASPTPLKGKIRWLEYMNERIS